jgi:Flp pilus assembly pilin Flp
MRSLLRDTRGASYVEYVTLVSLVTIAGAAAVGGLGVPMLRLFRYVQMMLALPIP